MTLGKYKRPMKRTKKFTVNHLDVELNKQFKSNHLNLLSARIFSRKMFRMGRFISLTNENGTLLTI